MPSVWHVIRNVTGITAAIDPIRQVGNSQYGTLDMPEFPTCLTNNPMPDGFPWGSRDCSSDPADIPNTGVTRHYDFTIARAVVAPDGIDRDAILVNGQFPGPTIEANWGDWIEVVVHNDITGPEEGTSVHWHGMLQKDTPWYDGVPSIGQCPIAPGSSFTYRFRADLYGTSWWHSHYSAQYNGGVQGPIVIYGPSQEDYDIDIGPVVLTDWYHEPYFEIVQDVVGTDLSKLPPKSDNNLINGRNTFDCSSLPQNSSYSCEPANLSKFKFKKGKTHRLRLMNTGADGVQKFSIDGHTMKVIAHDFVPLEPYETDVVTLGVAQRTDVLVEANAESDAAVWMRATLLPGTNDACGGTEHGQAVAAIYYDDADVDSVPTTRSSVTLDRCTNDPLTQTVPVFPMTPSEPSFTQFITVNQTINETGHPEWQMNNVAYHANFNHPVLFLAAEGNFSYPEEWNAYNYGSNSSVRFVLENLTPFVHPFHLHGHDFYVLAEGEGSYPGSVPENSNPTRRDTHILPASGYMVMQIEANNPGAWPFHCHVAWHLSGGLSMTVITQPDQINPIPDIMPQTCADWEIYSANNVVDQIDGGS
ncbi:Cupredoxin [Lineolata rhizophorae]|uniref:Cupredoxin n=1 Tax=Lineolata rhizophorae TaxID=578093 RepID=A0A6A6P6J8_9PEZI|nr:Cupredoxin [Lineolata rhizophorae]